MSTQSKIIAFLGPDRVGKTTLAERLYESRKHNYSDDKTLLYHGVEPKDSDPDLYGQYDSALDWVMSSEGRVLILDRCWICSMTYEETRKGSPVSYRDVFRLECELMRAGVSVTYHLVKARWSAVAEKHKEEVMSEGFPFLRSFSEKMLARNREHLLYYKRTEEYLENHSLFPYCVFERG